MEHHRRPTLVSSGACPHNIAYSLDRWKIAGVASTVANALTRSATACLGGYCIGFPGCSLPVPVTHRSLSGRGKPSRIVGSLFRSRRSVPRLLKRWKPLAARGNVQQVQPWPPTLARFISFLLRSRTLHHPKSNSTASTFRFGMQPRWWRNYNASRSKDASACRSKTWVRRTLRL